MQKMYFIPFHYVTEAINFLLHGIYLTKNTKNTIHFSIPNKMTFFKLHNPYTI